MFMRALVAFLVLPGVVAFFLPPIIGYVDPWRYRSLDLGRIVMVIGVIVLLWCVRDFYVSGKGTLAPWDPPKSLVIVGLYRHVRNPMYVGVLTLVIGWAIWLGSFIILAYSAFLIAGFHIRVIMNEEPWLQSQFGCSWDAYASEVRRWIPRFSPWRGVPNNSQKSDRHNPCPLS